MPIRARAWPWLTSTPAMSKTAWMKSVDAKAGNVAMCRCTTKKRFARSEYAFCRLIPTRPLNGFGNLTVLAIATLKRRRAALSDAFKRAAVRWGIGRYLYDLDSPWVALEAAGRSFKIAAHEYKRLEELLRTTKPANAPPKPITDQDVVEGVKNWVAKHKVTIRGFKLMPGTI